MTHTAYERAEQYMLDCMQGATHDVLHVRRVLGYALMLCEDMTANRDIVILAALLHDIGRPEEDADPSLDHAAIGAEKAHAFLLADGYSEPIAGAVANCIQRHRFRKGAAPDTPEAQILYDADKLEVSGAMGAARTLQFGGEIGEPLYNTDAAGNPLPGGPQEPDSFFREYQNKLRTLTGRLFTEKARQLSRERLPALEAYAEALWREIEEAHNTANAALAGLLKEVDNG